MYNGVFYLIRRKIYNGENSYIKNFIYHDNKSIWVEYYGDILFERSIGGQAWGDC